MTIIGVVPRTRNEAPGEFNTESATRGGGVFVSVAQDPQGANTLHIRTKLRDIGPLVTAVKREVRALDADQPIGQITTMDEAVAFQSRDASFNNGVVRRVCCARASARERRTLRGNGTHGYTTDSRARDPHWRWARSAQTFSSSC